MLSLLNTAALIFEEPRSMYTSKLLLGKGTSAVTMSADGSDSYIQFGDKTTFGQTTAHGVILGSDNGNIKFGGEDATEPGVLGEELKKVLDILLKAEIQKNTVLIGVNTVTATAKTAAGDAPGAAKLVKQNVELQKLNSEMVQVIAVGPYLSKIVKTK